MIGRAKKREVFCFFKNECLLLEKLIYALNMFCSIHLPFHLLCHLFHPLSTSSIQGHLLDHEIMEQEELHGLGDAQTWWRRRNGVE